MKNDKENTENVTIETNNDVVLYSVMLSFLKAPSSCFRYQFDNHLII